MRIIITGATGFIGRNLSYGLRADGHEIVAIGRSARVGGELRAQDIEFRAADLTNANQAISAFSPADCVVHCAARASDWGRYEDFFAVNVVGTRNVAAACESHGIGRIVFVSSPSIYFNGRDRLNISEGDALPAVQRSHYAKTKLESEAELLALAAARGWRVMILRPRAVYGPYDSTLLPRILRMSEKPKIALINGGKALIDITYVDNFVDAVRKALVASDDAWNQAYNISNGDPITVREWFARTLEIIGRPFHPKDVPESVAKAIGWVNEVISRLPFGPDEPQFTRFSVGYMAKSMTMSIEKAKRRIGYEPRFGNAESFKAFAQWYRSEKN